MELNPSLINNEEERRRTTRVNAGIHPPRYGESNTEIVRTLIPSNNESTTEVQTGERTSSSRSISGVSSIWSRRSGRSLASNRNSTIRQSQIDVQTEEDVNQLEEALDEKDREIQIKELAAKNQIDILNGFKADLLLVPVEDGEAIQNMRKRISQHQDILSKLQAEINQKRIDFTFQSKSVRRQREQIRRKAELQKQIVAESQEDDNLSQKLSDSEEEVGSNNENRNLEPERMRRPAQLQADMDNFAAALQREKQLSETRIDEDALLIRLRRLQGPTVAGAGAQPLTTTYVSPPKSNEEKVNNDNMNSYSDPMTNQFMQVMTKTFEKFASSSNSTDKFLARQVQGKDLPQFSGRPEEWSTFITAFENSTQACHYNHQDNLPRLQKCLKSEALKTVQCLLARPENVPAIIAKLKMRFGRAEHIVEMLISKAKEVPPFKEDRLDLLIDFGLAVDNLVETIKALNCHEHLNSPQLLEEFSKKLPITHRTKWMEWVTSDPSRKENLQTFAEWMSKQTDIACKLCPPKWKEEAQPKRFDNRHKRKEEKVWVAAESSPAASKIAKYNPKDQNCFFCNEKGHRVLQCTKFEKESIEDKWKWVKENRHCFGCIKYGHSAKDCRSKKECGKEGCKITHHPYLHKHSKPSPAPAAAEAITNTVKSYHFIDKKHTNLMVLPVNLSGPKGNLTTLAFLDPGATVTVIDGNIAKQLGLEGPTRPFAHSGLHPTMTEANSRSVSVKISNLSGDKSFNLKNVRTIANVSLPRQAVRTKMIKKWPHLKDLGIQSYDRGQPTILIGQDNVHLCNTQELILGPPNAPGAGRTELGWVLIGQVDESARSEYSYMIHEQADDELHQLVKRHFTTEDFGAKVTTQNQRSKEDVRAQQIMDATINKLDNCWEIGLLWKNDDVELPNSKDVAKNRLLQMERKMDRDSHFAEQYIAKIEEYQQKGFARRLSPEEASQVDTRTYYLPHFMSRNPKKPSKLRFVFDAAAKVKGVSLNDALLKGPDKLTNLPSVLFKFRLRAIAVTADIKDMFHRVKVQTEDSSSQRFLWRGLDRNKDPEVFEMGVLIFGASCSPACAQEVKNLNALQFQEQYPESTKAIIQNHYVDDYLDSLDTVSEAVQRFQEIRTIHSSGGFNICNWITNSRELQSVIPTDLLAPGSKNLDLEGSTERVLGLFWRPEEDVFTFSKTFLKVNTDIIQGDKLPTKRELLSLVMSIYDPLGFLAHFTVKARILLQEIWRTEIGWDDEIPNSLQDRWRRWLEELKKISHFSMPRCYSPELSTAKYIQLHIFGDASEQAFGAVGYFRIQKESAITVSFVMAKAKVAPTKHLTIPRLELQAAVLGTRLANFIQSSHGINIERVIYWSDSSTVISWIRADGNKFKQFVANRIGEIHESSEVKDWRWIPTDQNVADELTRDSQPSNWSADSRWVNGPSFLLLPEDQWPKPNVPVKRSDDTADEDIEIKKDYICSVVVMEPVVDLTRFSNWNRLVRCIGKHWRQSQQLANMFWKRWVQEYLPTLLHRGKWYQQQEPIQIDDIVLVVDNQLTRNSWPMGRVVMTYPGKDGVIRVVDVKTIQGTYKRPVMKLCKLDVLNETAAIPISTTINRTNADDSVDLGVHAAA